MSDSDTSEYQFSGQHPHRNREVLQKLYHGEGMTLREVGSVLGVASGTVYKWMQRNGIECRRKTEACGGSGVSVRTHKKGYEHVAVSEGTRTVQFRLHQLVAIAAGADPHKIFSDGEYHVHHINSISWDNRPENLAVMSASDHIREHDLPNQFHGPYIRDENGYWTD